MKLWYISQNVRNGYDTYDCAVVAAETEEEAKMMHPDGSEVIEPDNFGTWANTPEEVRCEYIGEAEGGTPKGVICASFNAG